mmetsp:Transcript_31150/g.98889  ORF Transcript_31150/g.98889 Transcript_31150/m.98889 type:complete len:576 (+) Transcript_31150:429-2156(+)
MRALFSPAFPPLPSPPKESTSIARSRAQRFIATSTPRNPRRMFSNSTQGPRLDVLHADDLPHPTRGPFSEEYLRARDHELGAELEAEAADGLAAGEDRLLLVLALVRTPLPRLLLLHLVDGALGAVAVARLPRRPVILRVRDDVGIAYCRRLVRPRRRVGGQARRGERRHAVDVPRRLIAARAHARRLEQGNVLIGATPAERALALLVGLDGDDLNEARALLHGLGVNDRLVAAHDAVGVVQQHDLGVELPHAGGHVRLAPRVEEHEPLARAQELEAAAGVGVEAVVQLWARRAGAAAALARLCGHGAERQRERLAAQGAAARHAVDVDGLHADANPAVEGPQQELVVHLDGAGAHGAAEHRALTLDVEDVLEAHLEARLGAVEALVRARVRALGEEGAQEAEAGARHVAHVEAGHGAGAGAGFCGVVGGRGGRLGEVVAQRAARAGHVVVGPHEQALAVAGRRGPQDALHLRPGACEARVGAVRRGGLAVGHVALGDDDDEGQLQRERDAEVLARHLLDAAVRVDDEQDVVRVVGGDAEHGGLQVLLVPRAVEDGEHAVRVAHDLGLQRLAREK